MSDPQDAARLDAAEASLMTAMSGQAHLRRLATTPLLSALLCVLNLDQRAQLPTDRMELYRISLDMLLEGRDRARNVVTPDRVPSGDQALILQDVAYWLLKNSLTSADRERVEGRIATRLRQMPQVAMTAAGILDHLLVRSGVIREPAVGQVDFVHRTFQEYLAAKEIADSDEMEFLVAQAHRDEWREVVLMAPGHANAPQRRTLLAGLLARAKAEDGHSRYLLTLAVGCLRTARELDVALRDAVEASVEGILPPASVAEAESLAVASELLPILLDEEDIHSPDVAAATVRALSFSGSPDAFPLLRRCAKFDHPGVASELTRAWQSFDIEPYAKDVLSSAPSVRYVELRDHQLVPLAGYISSLEAVSWSFGGGHGRPEDLGCLERLQMLRLLDDPLLHDIAFVERMPKLRHLALHSVPQVDLRPAFAVPSLKGLVFDVQIQGQVDARASRLIELTLHRLQGTVSAPALPPSLQSLHLHHPHRLVDFAALSRLANIEQLTSLSLTGNPKTSLVGIDAWAETLTGFALHKANAYQLGLISRLHKLRTLRIDGQWVKSLAFVAGLSDLRSISFRTEGHRPHLGPLAEHPHLTDVFIEGWGPVDLSPFAGRTGLRVTSIGRHVFYGVGTLGPGCRIVQPRGARPATGE
jgi:hypothetical protein